MGKTFLNYNLNNDKVGDVYLVMYSNLNSTIKLNNRDTPRPTLTNSYDSIESLSSFNNNTTDNDINFINGIHYTLVIDVGGESLCNVPIGLEVHITSDKTFNLIQLDFERKFKLNTVYNEQFIYLGKIENIYHKGCPLEWSFGLTRAIATYWFNDFLNLNNCSGNDIINTNSIINNSSQTNPLLLWSNEKNCLTFSKFLIQKFNYNNTLNIEWPFN